MWQSVVLAIYIAYNLFAPHPFDPFPFIFLNLVLSFQAAYTAPIILMSHNSIAERDRALAAQDRENTHQILESIKKLEHKLISEVNEAVDEITETIEDSQNETETKS